MKLTYFHNIHGYIQICCDLFIFTPKLVLKNNFINHKNLRYLNNNSIPTKNKKKNPQKIQVHNQCIACFFLYFLLVSSFSFYCNQY